MATSPGRTARLAAALAVGAFTVHELRFALAPDHAGPAVHGYLASAPALLTGLLVLALGRSLAGLATPPGAARAPSLARRWVAASTALAAVHGAQEAAERLVAGAAAPGPDALLALPLCLAAGAVLALALRGADAAVAARPALVAWRPGPVLPVPALVVRRPRPDPLPRAVLAVHLAGRAPPASRAQDG